MSIPVLSQKLNTLVDKYDIEINCRTQYYSARSETWQDSDKGDDYLRKTETLRVAIDRLRNARMDMEEIEE